MNNQKISPALQLIAAGGIDKEPMNADEAIAARKEIEAKVSAQVYAELDLMVGEKLRQAQHALVDAEHGQGPKGNGCANELAFRVDMLRNLRDLYAKKCSG